MRILLVEDHPDVRGAMKALLDLQIGWQVCGEAMDGVEAVKKAAELKPDLIVMDLSMPKMDGLQASQLISAADPHTPILLYTNYYLTPDLISKAKEAGVWQVLTKDAPKQLLQAVQDLHIQSVEKATELAAQADTVGALPDQDLALDTEGSATE